MNVNKMYHVAFKFSPKLVNISLYTVHFTAQLQNFCLIIISLFAEVKDDEDSEDDYDYNDSFINDENESSCEPSDVDDNESDWQPDDDELGCEDVTELVSEAKRFTKNKKMLKPT